jgi:pilus assembly protein CpaC
MKRTMLLSPLILATGLTIILSAVLSVEASAADHYLPPGQSVRIATSAGAGGIKIKGRKSIEVQDLQSELKVTAQSIGHAIITVGSQVHNIHVVPENQIEFLNAVQDRLKEMMGLRVVVRSGHIEIRGELLRLQDWQDLAELAEAHSAQYKMAARLDATVAEAAREWVKEKLHQDHLNPPQLLLEPEAKALISTDQKDLATIWEKSLRPLGIQPVYEKSQIAIETLVRVRIVVAEVNKRVQSQLGIQWPEMIAATVAPGFKGPSQIEVFLKAMERDGLGQILASPSLLARSGSEADFLAGGEFGIKVSSGRTKEVIWKRHGIYLKVKPRADRSGRMSVELTTEVSLIDGSQAVDGIPGLKTNRITTHFDLARPQTVILSGLIRNDWGEEREGVSGLAKLPILGGLFRSKNFYANKSELVIFVTPEIVNESAPDSKSLYPKDWRSQ